MTHPLIDQLRFTRSEFKRAVEGISDEDARKRFPPMNCISWNIGHLAWQEQKQFLYFGQGKILVPMLDEVCAKFQPASTPPLNEVWAAWETVTKAADPWLDSLTDGQLLQFAVRDGVKSECLWGSVVYRVIYHYWYHLGENAAIRQNLGHTDLPQFVGDIDRQAPFRTN